ncbi:MAG: hypothetical protein AAB276_06945, partial [Pseudomonadota bacterium]
MRPKEAAPTSPYFQPLSYPLAQELSSIAQTVTPEKKTSVESLIPKLQQIFQQKDRSSAWGQMAFDGTRFITSMTLLFKTYGDFMDVIKPGIGDSGSKPVIRVLRVLTDIAFMNLVANIPGPNKFKQYDVAAARSQIVEKAQAGTL